MLLQIYSLLQILLYFCRIGTCGGIGLPPGTVVVTEEAVDGRVRPVLDTVNADTNLMLNPCSSYF